MAQRKYPIRGELFTAREAADRFDVLVSTIYSAKQKGTLDSIGVKRGPKPYPVRVRGIIFNSPRETAKHNNVKIATVYSSIENGKENTIGKIKNPDYDKEVYEWQNKTTEKASVERHKN